MQRVRTICFLLVTSNPLWLRFGTKKMVIYFSLKYILFIFITIMSLMHVYTILRQISRTPPLSSITKYHRFSTPLQVQSILSKPSNCLHRPVSSPILEQIAKFSSNNVLRHGKENIARGEGPYSVTFVTPDGSEVKVRAVEGDTMLDLSQRYDIDLECACEGSIACSTCHVIVDPEYYEKMEEPSDEENDMLDLAFGLTDTSRLGCQIEMRKELDGLKVTMPAATRNMRVDGSKPTHH